MIETYPTALQVPPLKQGRNKKNSMGIVFDTCNGWVGWFLLVCWVSKTIPMRGGCAKKTLTTFNRRYGASAEGKLVYIMPSREEEKPAQ